MKRLLVVLASALLVLGLALPTMAASLKISGEYIFEASYEDGELGTVDDKGDPLVPTSNFFDFSTLKLTLDYNDGGSLMLAHVPLELTVNTGDSNAVNVDLADDYYFAFNGTPLKLSLTNIAAKEDSPYAFQSFGDPLGLVKTLDATTTFKAVGNVGGLGVVGYVIDYVEDDDTTTTDKNEAADIEYELLRLTYGLPGGYTLGGIYAVKAPVMGTTAGQLGSQLEGVPEDLTRNLALDLTGPLPVSEGAKLTAAVAGSQTKVTGDSAWGDSQNALKLSVSDIKLGAFTVAGDIRAVDPDFVAVAPETDDDNGESEILTYKGEKQFAGSVTTPLDLGGKEVKLTVSDDYRLNYDKTKPVIDPWNEAVVEGQFGVAEGLTATVGGSYKTVLADEFKSVNYADEDDKYKDYDKGDYTRSVYGKLEYKPVETLTVTGEINYTDAKQYDVKGSGIKLAGGVEATPLPGVKASADVTYGTGKYDFFDNEVPVADDFSRTDATAYVEAKQTFQPGGVKSVDVVLASGADLSSTRKPYAVGYGESKVNVDDKVSTKLALLYGVSEDHIDDYTWDEPMKIFYGGVDYKVSADSTLSLGYSNKNEVGNVYAAYAVKLGVSTVTVSYGENRLDDPCDGDYDADKPWAWLCTIGGAATRDNYYKLKISIPF